MALAFQASIKDRTYSLRFNHPCPICGGGQDGHTSDGTQCTMGFESDDGHYAHCGTIPSGHRDRNGLTWSHLRAGSCDCGQTHDGAAERPAPQLRASKPLREYHGRQYLPATVTQGKTFDTYTFAEDSDFTAADGTLRYVERRYERPSAAGGKPDKTVRQYTHRGDDVWVAALECEPLLWNLPALMAAPTDAPIYVFEGPRKARIAQEALQAAGVAGVCTSASGSKGGAAKVDMSALAGRRVIVVRDEGVAGREYAQTFTSRALAAGASGGVLLLPGLPAKGDVVEYLAAGHDGADLARLADDTPIITACQPQSQNTSEVAPHVQVAPLAPREDGCGRCREWRSRALEAEARLHHVTREQTAQAQVMRNPKLSDSVKLTYMATRVVLGAKPVRDERGMAQVKREEIATLAGKSEDTVSRNLSILKMAGAVKHDAPAIKNEDGSVHHYELWLGETEDFDRPENITPIDAPRPHGGARTPRKMRATKVPESCIVCSSTHVTIRAELVCLEPLCGAVEPLNLDLPEAPQTPMTSEVAPHVQVAALDTDTSPSLEVRGRNLNVRQSHSHAASGCEHPPHMRHALRSGVVACGGCGQHVEDVEQDRAADGRQSA